jgi:hypothetical protein
MPDKQTKRWQDYQAEGIRPTRYKYQSIVFSDKSIAAPLQFSLNAPRGSPFMILLDK